MNTDNYSPATALDPRVDWDQVFEYMHDNNLSSYSNRADCVDDGPDEGEWPIDMKEPRTDASRPALVQEPVEYNSLIDRIAAEACAFVERQETNTLTEKDKEWIWYYGEEDEKALLGDWTPPQETLLNISKTGKRGLEGYMNQRKEEKERELRWERGEQTEADVQWRNDIGWQSKL
jgi:hypothetical protein